MDDPERSAPLARRWGRVTVASFLVGLTGNFTSGWWQGVAAVAAVVFLPAFLLMQHHDRRARLLDRRKQAAAAPSAERPPVVYLRSFDDDHVAGRLRGDRTEEEALVAALAHIGPVVAVARPGETLPMAGAHRTRLGDAVWQEEVAALLRRASLVVLRTGGSPGLRWEWAAVRRIVPPGRTLLVVDDAAELREMLVALSPSHGLPGWRLRWPFLRRRVGSLRGFVVFDGDWRPRTLPLPRAAAWLLDLSRDDALVHGVLHRALRPVYATLGVAPAPPRRDVAKIAWALFVIVLFAWALWRG